MAKKGRKIYRAGTYQKRRRLKSIFRGFLSVIAVGALIFVGYSVGKPIIKYLEEGNEITESEPWTPPVTTDLIEENNITSVFDNETKDVSTNETSAIVSTIENNTDGFTSLILPEDALGNPTLFANQIKQAKTDGYTAVSVTLKAKGGKVFYKTDSEMAALDENAIVGNMPIMQITSMIKNSGLKMIAEINALEDNNRYGEYRDGSYHMLDGSTWLDAAVNMGGKPWLSPFEDETKEYIRFLTEEAVKAGFDYVTISGLKFPDFRNSDLNYIGNSVKDTNRYKSLIQLADIAKTTAEENNCKFFLRLNAADIIYDKCEVFKPNELNDYCLLIDYNPAEINESIIKGSNEIPVSELKPDEKFKIIFLIIKEKCTDDNSIIPVISENGLNHADYDNLIKEIVSEGYSSFFVK